jgi:hypothetical protein
MMEGKSIVKDTGDDNAPEPHFGYADKYAQ